MRQSRRIKEQGVLCWRGGRKEKALQGRQPWAVLKDEWDIFQAEEKGVRPVGTEQGAGWKIFLEEEGACVRSYKQA